MNKKEINKQWSALEDRMEQHLFRYNANPKALSTGEWEELSFFALEVDGSGYRVRCSEKANDIHRERKSSKSLSAKFKLLLNAGFPPDANDKEVITAVRKDIIEEHQELMKKLDDLKVDEVDGLLTIIRRGKEERRIQQEQIARDLAVVKTPFIVKKPPLKFSR